MAERFAQESGFPGHGLVVRPEIADDTRIIKDIRSWETFEEVFSLAKALSSNATVFIEVDLRAHANPTRMELIGRAAEDLADRLRSRCPSCAAPGFWRVERIGGLPCSACEHPTAETLAEVWGCVRCAARETREVNRDSRADPGRCDYCNP